VQRNFDVDLEIISGSISLDRRRLGDLEALTSCSNVEAVHLKKVFQ